MNEEKIKARVRLIIIKEDKILLSFVKDEDFYFYIGGRIEFGEPIDQACIREIKEECKANFQFKKILYVRDYIKPKIDEHSIELYILGDIDKFEEIEGLVDDEFGGNHWQTWVELDELKGIDVRPRDLTDQLLRDYRKGFPAGAVYLGGID